MPKVFVTVGSVAPFDELVRAVDSFAGVSGINCTIQIGKGEYVPRNAEWFRFADDLSRWYSWADIVVSHNGAGTIFELLHLGKKVIAVPNPNTNQMENIDIIVKLAREGCLLPCLNPEGIGKAIMKAKSWSPVPYRPPPCLIPNVIRSFLKG